MAKSTKARRRFSSEFKAEALRLVASGAAPVRQIAQELGVHVETLRLWRRQAERAAPAGSATSRAVLEEENRRLRRENARLREAREILKKATAFFARTAP